MIISSFLTIRKNIVFIVFMVFLYKINTVDAQINRFFSKLDSSGLNISGSSIINDGIIFKNRLYIATANNGLHKIALDKLESEYLKITEEEIVQKFFIVNKELFFICDNGAIYSENGFESSIDINREYLNFNVSDVYVDDSLTWISTLDNGVFVIKNTSKALLNTTDDIPYHFVFPNSLKMQNGKKNKFQDVTFIYSIFKDKNKYLWFCTNIGLIQFVLNEFMLFKEKGVYHYSTKYHEYILLMSGSKISKFKDSKSKIYDINISSKYRSKIRHVMLDSNFLWIASNKIAITSLKDLNSITLDSSLGDSLHFKSQIGNKIINDSINNRVWITTEGSGLYYIDKESVYRYIKDSTTFKEPIQITSNDTIRQSLEAYPCEGVREAGNYGTTTNIHFLDASTQVKINWDMYKVPDRLIVFEGPNVNGKIILDTKKVKGKGEEILNINTNYITVKIIAKESKTSWKYELKCN